MRIFVAFVAPGRMIINRIIRLTQVEELRRKYTCRIQEQEEQIENLLVKINNLEKQKSRLQSEVEILIIDLEKVNFLAIIISQFFGLFYFHGRNWF